MSLYFGGGWSFVQHGELETFPTRIGLEVVMSACVISPRAVKCELFDNVVAGEVVNTPAHSQVAKQSAGGESHA